MAYNVAAELFAEWTIGIVAILIRLLLDGLSAKELLLG
jgi:hypothetical protein